MAKRNVAVVLAGGKGSRMGTDIPKQFFEINGKTVLEYSVEAFDSNPSIDEVVIVSHKDYIDKVKALVSKNNYKKVAHVLEGGKERYDSSLAAVRKYAAEDVILILHDAARPLVSKRIINDVISTMKSAKACGVAIASTDTILVCNDGVLSSVPDRKTMYRAQTPQAFDIEVIRSAYEIGLKDPAFTATDDCGVVLKYRPDIPIRIVDGEDSNLKVTYRDDLKMVELYLNN
jgi:2-C-methyl-D-erythritol 4-phosphate cytidylyltransferase